MTRRSVADCYITLNEYIVRYIRDHIRVENIYAHSMCFELGVVIETVVAKC